MCKSVLIWTLKSTCSVQESYCQILPRKHYNLHSLVAKRYLKCKKFYKSQSYVVYVLKKIRCLRINQKTLWQFHWMDHVFAHSCIFIWQYVKHTISITVLVCQPTIASVLIGFARVPQTKTRQKKKWNSEIWGWLYFGGHESCILCGILSEIYNRFKVDKMPILCSCFLQFHKFLSIW